jgi:hypothetical protein
MEERIEARSENARHVILSYGSKLYYVSSVNISDKQSDPMQKAVFHALGVLDNKKEDLELDIPKSIYEVLVEYAKLDNPDLVLALYVENGDFKWTTMSETWFKNYMNEGSVKKYVT